MTNGGMKKVTTPQRKVRLIDGEGDRSITIDKICYRAEVIPRMDDMEDQEDEEYIIDLSASSETPYERWWGTEILSHAEGAINMERISDGANLLWMHDWEKYIGVIESARVEGGKLRCQVKFDTHELATKIKNSIKAGILSKVSVGYMIDELKMVEGSEKGDTYLATKWTPYEVSIVTIPADNTVGVGRSADDCEPDPEPIQHATPTEPPIEAQQETKSMPIDIDEIRQQERERIASIQGLGRKHNLPEKVVNQLVDNASIEEARTFVLDWIGQEKQEPIAKPVDPLGLTKKEDKSYSLRSALLACIDKDWSRAGFERECSDAIASKLNRRTNGFYLPVRDLSIPLQTRATYAVGAPTTGGNTVDTILDSANLIMYLRNRMMVMQMGARMLSGLEGNVDIPRQSGTSNVYWIATEGGNVTQDESTFDLVQIRPKTVGVKSRFTRSMLLQSSIDIEAFVRQDLSDSMALGIDRAAIAGTGASGQPTGILNQAGVPTVALGTNGAAPTWASIVQLETELAQDNADVGSLGYLTNAKVRGKLKTTVKNPAGTDSDWIWENGTDPVIGMLNGYMAGVSNQVPSNLTKGTGTNLSAIIFGNFADILIGEWGVLEILPNPYGSGYDSGSIEIRALQTVDVQIRHPESFVDIIDAVTT
jgi:HK97 family phage major capsid protein/HK97 family phage prohead protease